MTIDIAIVFIILIAALVLFLIDKIPVDLTALLILAALLATGIITPEEGIAGFSNSATVTVAAMFVLSAALFNTGALNFLNSFIRNCMKKKTCPGLLILMLITGVISAFINNTAVVALFMPIVLNISRSLQISPSKLLMPLSFAAIMGGVCTLIGTSTNILASSLIEQIDQAPIGMFEMTSFGIIVLVVGILYMTTIGSRLLPDRGYLHEMLDDFQMADYFTEIIILPGSVSANMEVHNSPLIKDIDIDIIEIHRDDGTILVPDSKTIIRPNDILKVRCDIEKLKLLQSREGIIFKSDKKFLDEDLSLKDSRLVEAVITPNSVLIGRTLKGINFRNKFGATVLAIRHRGRVMREKLGKTRLVAGDVLLIEARKRWLEQLKRNSAFIIISEVSFAKTNSVKMYTTIFVMAAVVVSAALNIIPIVSGAIIGSVLLVLTRCITLEEAYKAIDWKVIFFLAGLVTLGLAMEKSGGADFVTGIILNSAGTWGNHALISTFFFMSMILTAFMSNNASVALLLPIAVYTSESLGVSARPFIMAVTFAASIDFMTPIGYQTNTMIYSPGNYRFTDYLKIGTPLNIIFWILGSLLIPYFFPF